MAVILCSYLLLVAKLFATRSHGMYTISSSGASNSSNNSLIPITLCGACAIAGGAVQVIYFPEANYTAPPPTLVTVVSDGYTL